MPKTLLPLLLLLAAALPARAQEPTGFYVLGDFAVHYLDGGGAWNGEEFSPTALLSDDDDGVVGFAWSDHLNLGVRPGMGWRWNSRVALELGVDLSIAKRGQQTATEYTTTGYYEETANVDWVQRRLDLMLVVDPGLPGRASLYGGVTRSWMDLEVVAYQGDFYSGSDGSTYEDAQYQTAQDSKTVTGFLLGARWDIPVESERSEVFLALEYAHLETDGMLFDVPDWEVNGGGVSLRIGARFFPFAGEDP